MKKLAYALIWAFIFMPAILRADHKDLAVYADPSLIGPGLMAFLLPRFSLKTGVSVHLEPLPTALPGQGVVLQETVDTGLQVMIGPEATYVLVQIDPSDLAVGRFAAWLTSEIGQRTIGQFTRDGDQPFTGAFQDEPVEAQVALTGDAIRGEQLSYANCGRCHVIGARNRMNGIGSTPSFALLRSFDNWQDRFLTFYTLNPHPSFSQITGITDPFDHSLPPPISPLSLTQGELADIVAFTGTIKPADLGAPLVHQ